MKHVETMVGQSMLKTFSAEWRGVLSEFVSTLLLLFFGCMSCIPIDSNAPNPALYGPLGFGLTVMFNIQIFGHISGAYMNPMVTIIAVIWGRISTCVGIAYILAECAGAILGYGLLMTMAPVDMAGNGICMTEPHSGINSLQAVFIEVFLSAALALINYAIWDPVNAHNTDTPPLKFGLTIVGLSIVGGPLTGASMNPARSLAPAVWANRWDDHWVYWVGPLIGGILSAVFYKYVWLKEPPLKIQNDTPPVKAADNSLDAEGNPNRMISVI